MPRPNGTLLYIKLRDDPATVNTLVLPVFPDERSTASSRGLILKTDAKINIRLPLRRTDYEDLRPAMTAMALPA